MENEKELLKEKIRERYKGINPEDCEIIPAFEQPKLYDENSQKRVAAYARVSTIDIKNTQYVELLINPTKKLFGVRSSDVKSSRNAVQWAKTKGNNYYSKVIPGTAFLPNLYELLNWDLDHKYRLRGTVHNKKEETFITFNTTEKKKITN